jgi:glyoxylase-like metal-dependent hydrolase (beta-lactamase superfamily II)
MSMWQRWCVFAFAGLLVGACSSGTAQRQLAQDAVTAMGGADKLKAIQTVVMKGGTGTRTRVGQVRKAGEADATAKLSNVVETLDLANGRAAYDYEIQIDTFMQHRVEILTKRGEGEAARPVGIESVGGVPIAVGAPGLFSWGTQNSPEFLLRRNAVSIALAASDSASASLVAEDKEFNGKAHKYGKGTTADGEEVGLYFDPASKLLAGFEVLDTETMLGDVDAQYSLSDYKSVGGVMLPHRITVRKGGQDYSDVQFASISIDDPAAASVFAIPEAVAADADKAAADPEFFPMRLVKAANGVFQAVAYRHHSMVVEFPTFVAVVEAPYLEVQSKVLVKRIAEQFPTKPIRYAAVTHPHFDHIGGVRGIAAAGATILVARGHEAAMKEVLDTPHTHPKDLLETRRATAGKMEVYEGKKEITEGSQKLELHAFSGSPHVEPMVLAYVPGPGVLFQSDLFFPGTGGGGPAVVQLLDSVKKLGLRVNTNVGGHGGIGPFSEMVKAAAAKP